MQIFERALIVVGQPNDESMVYGVNRFSELIKLNIEVYMDRKCRHFGSDLQTATFCVKDKIDVRKNIPICLCVLRKIVFFKIKCKVTRQPIWFRYSPKMKYKRIDGERFGIFFDQELLIEATFSKHKFDAQIKRIEDFFKQCTICINCTNLSCVDCPK